MNEIISYLRILIVLSFSCVLTDANAQTINAITTVAGNGLIGYSGDGGPATNATLSNPVGVCTDQKGNVYFTDADSNVIRMIDSSGKISTIAGIGDTGYSGDGGLATLAKLYMPYDVKFYKGSIYIADYTNSVVRKISATGIISTVAGNGHRGPSDGDGGPATATRFWGVSGICFDSKGNLYISDYWNCRVRKVDTNGIVTNFAGFNSGSSFEGPDFTGMGGPATSAYLGRPVGLCADGNDNIYIADWWENAICMVDTSGIIHHLSGHNVPYGYTGDGGPAINAGLDGPWGISVDSSGNIYFADEYNNVIRRIDTSGIINTVVGTSVAGYNGDGGRVDTSEICGPTGLFISGSKMYISDNCNRRIRKVADTMLRTFIPLYSSPKLYLFPNPAGDQITVENFSDGDLYILNMKGIVIISQQVTNKTTVDISRLPAGAYILKAINEINTATIKFTKY